MTYILLYSERYGYLKNTSGGYLHNTEDFHDAQNFRFLDRAMEMREYIYRRFDEKYHIEVFSVD